MSRQTELQREVQAFLEANPDVGTVEVDDLIAYGDSLMSLNAQSTSVSSTSILGETEEIEDDTDINPPPIVEGSGLLAQIENNTVFTTSDLTLPVFDAVINGIVNEPVKPVHLPYIDPDNATLEEVNLRPRYKVGDIVIPNINYFKESFHYGKGSIEIGDKGKIIDINTVFLNNVEYQKVCINFQNKGNWNGLHTEVVLVESYKPVDNSIKENCIKAIKECILSVHDEDRFDIEILDNYNNINVIIHYPEITIRNSEKKSHVIKDLFVKIPMTWNKNNYKCLDHILGGRTSISTLEYNSQYCHSHLSKNASRNSYFTNFCLGYDSLIISLKELETKFKLDRFCIFLHELNSYVEWESLDGGPYIKMSAIGVSQTVSSNSIDTTSLTLLENKFFENTNDFTFEETKDIIGNSLLTINRNWLEEHMSEIVSLQDDTWNGLKQIITCTKVNNSYYSITSNDNIDSILRSYKNNTSSSSRIKFKGVIVPLKVYKENENTSESSNKKLYLRPTVLNQLLDSLNKKLNNYYENQ